MVEERKMRSDVILLINELGNPEETKKVLIALSDRRVLVKKVAVKILTSEPFNWTEKRAKRFVYALQFCDFVVEGNFGEFFVRPYED